jgi:hypothetical protein
MPRAICRFTALSLIASLLAVPVRADITRFDLSGTVTDRTGAALPGVTVTLHNVDTGFNRSTVTDAEGRYSFNAVPPTGRWTLSAELQGFAPQHREGLEFLANTKPVINLELNVGSLQGAVTVQAEDRTWQWGPSDTDARHVFVLTGLYDAPLGIRAGGVLFVRSGFPYTGVAGLDDERVMFCRASTA